MALKVSASALVLWAAVCSGCGPAVVDPVTVPTAEIRAAVACGLARANVARERPAPPAAEVSDAVRPETTPPAAEVSDPVRPETAPAVSSAPATRPGAVPLDLVRAGELERPAETAAPVAAAPTAGTTQPVTRRPATRPQEIYRGPLPHVQPVQRARLLPRVFRRRFN